MSDWKMQREDVEKLINAYRKLKCLWDFRSKEYKRYDLKKYSWQKLGNMFGKKSHEVKRKVKYLRSAYVSEKKKVDDSYGTSQIYRPNLFYYNSLNFLDSIVVCRKGPKFQNFEATSDSIAEYNEQPTETSLIVEDAVAPSPSPSPTPPSPPPPPQLVQRRTESHLKMKKQKQQHRLAPYYSKLDAAVNTLAEVTKTTTTEDSIYSAFAKTVALQLNQLPLINATATMSEIHQILSKNIIKSMLSKNRQSCITNRETVGHVDRKLSMQTELSEIQLGESKHQPNAFEEVSM